MTRNLKVNGDSEKESQEI